VKEEKDKLRDYMQGVFQDYEVVPDPEDWNRIEKTMSAKKNKKVLLWIFRAAAACLLLLMALYTGDVLIHPDHSTTRTAANQHEAIKTTPSSSVNAPPAAKLNVGPAKNQLNTKQMFEKADQSKLILPDSKSPLLADAQIKAVSNNPKEHQTESIVKAENRNDFVHSIKPRPFALLMTKDPLRYDRFILKRESLIVNTPENLKVALAKNSSTMKFKGFSLSNNSGLIIQSSSKEMMSYSGSFASQLASSMYLNSVKVFDNAYLSSLNIGNLFKNNSRDYLPPVTFGLNVNLALPNNWSLETGIQYTRLQSNGTVSINSSNAIQFSTNFRYKVDENLHYLGVPIILNYTFSQKRKTSLYFSTGLSFEKGIIAKYVANPEDNYPGMQPIYSHNAINGLQCSMNTGLGMSYKFIPHFELFGQPSFTYYFNSQLNNTTVYSIHPFIFNLRTGIRYTIK
jgi:hypothetical protein